MICLRETKTLSVNNAFVDTNKNACGDFFYQTRRGKWPRSRECLSRIQSKSDGHQLIDARAYSSTNKKWQVAMQSPLYRNIVERNELSECASNKTIDLGRSNRWNVEDADRYTVINDSKTANYP